MYSNPSKDWDDRERKLEEPESDEAKVEVTVHHDSDEQQQQDNEFPLSGLFCVWCHEVAIHIFEGNSICHDCYNKEITDRVKKRNKE